MRGQRTAFSSLLVGPRDGTQVARLGSKHFYLLSHLTGPRESSLSCVTDICKIAPVNPAISRSCLYIVLFLSEPGRALYHLNQQKKAEVMFFLGTNRLCIFHFGLLDTVLKPP